ncbi:MAG: O-antigen ligase family protein [Steroidobacteraceae bacterium]
MRLTREARPGLRWPAPATAHVLALAACAGIFVGVAGTAAGPRAIYYFAILGAIAIGGFVAVTRREPMRFAFLALFAALPLADVPIPPARLGVRLFDAVMLALAIALVARRLTAPPQDRRPLFPSPSLAGAWLLFAICAAFSLYPKDSAQALLVGVAVYAFFLCALDELRRPGGFERLAAISAAVVIVLSLGLFIDHFLQVNLSLRGGNLNQLSYVMGRETWRAGGFFQDPQKAGAFLASTIAFLLVLAVRGRFAGLGMRLLAWVAVAAGITALFTTIARGAIIACLAVSVLALGAFNRWPAGVKLLTAAAVAAALLVAAVVPAGAWLDLMPEAVAARFARMGEELGIRITIWFDTWDMFAGHPLTGVGPDAFRSYLLESRPGMTGYYGIGVADGAQYVPEQPENGYLTILYEGGLVGSAAALLVAGDALRRIFAVLARGTGDADARSEAIAALAGLATFGVTFMTLFTPGDARIAALLMFLLAIAWRHTLRTGAPDRACMRG